tara:strand:+ start:912 stop:1220 length:309 start_codon:yes stop_codon:yes gene_type:complete
VNRSEKALERWAVKAAKLRGIYVVKLALLQGGGWPDLSLFKDGRVAFLELKKDEKSPFQPLQKHYLVGLTRLGFLTGVAWNNEQVEAFLDEFEGGLNGKTGI